MSVTDGEKVNAAVTNAAYISRKTDSDTVAKIDLNDPAGVSGAAITNIQREFNGLNSFSGSTPNDVENRLPTWIDNSVGASTDTLKDRSEALTTQVATNITNITANTQEAADIRTTQGTSNGETDLGSFTGNIISANTTVKNALQELETEVDTLSGALVFQGTWNANTNTPALASGVGTTGHFYIVSVAGSTNLDGETDWQVGDWAVFGTSTWSKVDNSELVVSVNGNTGVVVLDTDDINEGVTNFYYTEARFDTSLGGADIGELANVDETGKAVTNVLAWDGANWSPAAAGGGFNRTSQNSNYTAALSDYVDCDTSGGDFTVTLPAAGNAGARIGVKNNDNGVVTIDGDGAETIDGFTDIDIFEYDSVILMDNGTNWIVTSREFRPKLQTKVLTADQIAPSDGTVLTDMTFSNLVIGQWYEAYCQVLSRLTSGADNVAVRIRHNGVTLGRASQALDATTTTAAGSDDGTVVFQAAATTVTFETLSYGANAQILGNSTFDETYSRLRTVPAPFETTEF